MRRHRSARCGGGPRGRTRRGQRRCPRPRSGTSACRVFRLHSLSGAVRTACSSTLSRRRVPSHHPIAGARVHHGGGFVIGNGDADYTLLANSGREVVVSMNYRLGIFGLLANSALGRIGRLLGLQDQQAALRWVQQNIRAFDGDPSNVTIFGESAGGSSVCDQIASPTAAGLFEKAFSVSGEYSTLFGSPDQLLNYQDCKSAPPSQAQAESAGNAYAAAVGCASASNVATCLRNVPASLALQGAGGGLQPVATARSLPRSTARRCRCRYARRSLPARSTASR